jgi:hypothetical protein
MKKVLVTIYDDNYKDLAEIVLPNIESYAKKYGYELKIYTESQDPARHIYWSKIKACRRLVDDYELVFWLDIDSLFTDFSQDFVEKYRNPSYIGVVNCMDRQPKDETECFWNVAAMLFNGQRQDTADFLDKVYNNYDKWKGHIWPEQLALVEIAESSPGAIKFEPICKLLNPIEFLQGTEKYKVGQDVAISLGGGPGAKHWKLDSLSLIKRMIK